MVYVGKIAFVAELGGSVPSYDLVGADIYLVSEEKREYVGTLSDGMLFRIHKSINMQKWVKNARGFETRYISYSALIQGPVDNITLQEIFYTESNPSIRPKYSHTVLHENIFNIRLNPLCSSK